jgi:hypothetical protein
MLIDDSKQNDQDFLKNFFGLTINSNKNPLNSFLGFLNESKNQLPLANLNFNLRFLPIKNSKFNNKFDEIFYHGLIATSLACRFFSKNLDKKFFEKNFNNYSLKFLENNGFIMNEESIKTSKKSKSFWSKIFNYLKIILREKEDFFYHNLVDSFKNPEDCYGNKVETEGFEKIIDTKTFYADFIKIYADKLKKDKIKILPNGSNICPEIDNYQSAFLILYKYFLQEKNELLQIKNKSVEIKKNLEKLHKFNNKEFKKFQKNFTIKFKENNKPNV